MRADPDLFVEIYRKVDRYYSQKVAKHGAAPLGVDWSCVPSQELRFVQLLKLCDFSSTRTLNDFGCGYGALLAYLAWRHSDRRVDYLGVDVSEQMISRAERLWRERPRTAFVHGRLNPRIADYSVASGVFNIIQDIPVDLWEQYVKAVLRHLHATSREGFAVNFVTAQPEGPGAKPGLYRASAEFWIEFCETALDARVEWVHGYGLREFTLLVRRQGRSAQLIKAHALAQ